MAPAGLLGASELALTFLYDMSFPEASATRSRLRPGILGNYELERVKDASAHCVDFLGMNFFLHTGPDRRSRPCQDEAEIHEQQAEYSPHGNIDN